MEKPQPTKLFYVPNVMYSITINPSDKYQFLGKPERLIKFMNFMNENVISWNQIGINYELYFELSEPRNTTGVGSRLHMHGTIEFRTNKAVRSFLLNEMYKITRYAVFDIDTIDDPLYWKAYCTKQQSIIHCEPLRGATRRKAPAGKQPGNSTPAQGE